jgi:alkylhydroperoxidase family enzyme
MSVFRSALAFAVLSLLTACVNDSTPPATAQATPQQSGQPGMSPAQAQALAAFNKRTEDANAVRTALRNAGITPLDRSVQSGHRSAILRTAVLNIDCSPRAGMDLHVTQAPKHGHVDLAMVEDFPMFPKGDAHASCNTKKVQNWIVYYTSEPGYVGGDAVLFEVIEGSTSTPMRREAFLQVHQ